MRRLCKNVCFAFGGVSALPLHLPLPSHLVLCVGRRSWQVSRSAASSKHHRTSNYKMCSSSEQIFWIALALLRMACRTFCTFCCFGSKILITSGGLSCFAPIKNEMGKKTHRAQANFGKYYCVSSNVFVCVVCRFFSIFPRFLFVSVPSIVFRVAA